MDDRAYTSDKKDLGGPHVLHITKYGSEELVGMKPGESTVKGTKEGKVQTVKALADLGAFASIISWDLAKKVTMIVFEKRDATLKDASNKYTNYFVIFQRGLANN